MTSHRTEERRWIDSMFDFPLDDALSLSDRIMLQEHIESGCLHWIDAIVSGNHQLAGLDTTLLPPLIEERLTECRRALAGLRTSQNT